MGRLSLLFLFTFNLWAESSDIVDRAEEARRDVQRAEKETRDVLRELYRLQTRVKEISKSRSRLNERMLSSDGDAQSLAQSVSVWQSKLDTEKKALTKRLNLLYRWNSPNLLPLLFSSGSTGEFEQNMRYLKRFAEQDFESMRNFRNTVVSAHREKTKLKSKIQNLLGLKKKVESEEAKLAEATHQKTLLLTQLKTREERGLKSLASLRAEHPELDALLQTGFFEKRGDLTPPIASSPQSTYGTYVDKIFHYRILRKGWRYQTNHEVVRSIFGGVVSYAGRLPGFSQTVVVDHGDHFYSVYALMGELKVALGDKLTEGQVLGNAGSNLHFEIRHFADAIDPATWIRRSAN